MTDAVQLMLSIREPMAAGFLEYPEGPLPLTYCRAYRRYYENCRLVYRAGAPLFPCGNTTVGAYWDRTDDGIDEPCVSPQYAHQYNVWWEKLEEKSPSAAEIFRDFTERFHYAGEWNHSMLNYKRILREGINGYEKRLLAMPQSDFRTALLDLIEGLRTYHARALKALPEMGAPDELIRALQKVPFSPPETAYEAIVALNFVLSLDGWDNVGRLDSILSPYHRGEDLRPYLRCMMENIQENDTWSITLGPDYSEVTKQALEASVGLARPLTQLRVTKDMPPELWELAAKRILESGGQPAFYNEDAIRERLMHRIPHLTSEDAMEFAGGGCTETAFAGLTCSGGTDENINVLKIFEDYMHQSLPKAIDFKDFYEDFMTLLHQKQDEQTARINAHYNERAAHCFAPIRTLFIDDCIDKETGWLQGGARYTFSVHSDSGIPNTVDSLLAIKQLVFDEKRYTAERFLALLTAEDEAFFKELKTCPAYGRGEEESDALMQNFTTRFYEHYLSAKLDLGIGFFPTAHQFRRHIGLGKCVGSTPDGRRAGSPEADSLAAVNGKSTKGPTVMLASASRYEQKDVYGMAVTNLSIHKKYSPEVIRALVEGYFDLGGTQLQITVTDKETLLDAKAHPDDHRDLIVRVGGYSEYFYKLDPAIQDAVIARTLFE